MTPRSAWLAAAILFGALAATGFALDALGAPLAFSPVIRLSRAESVAHGVLAAACLAAGLLPGSDHRRAKVGAVVLLASAAVLALSPSLLGLAGPRGFFAEPAQSAAYATAGAILALAAQKRT